MILFSEVQLENALNLISETDSGIVMLLSEVQNEKAPSSISVIDLGMMMVSSEVQSLNAYSLIFVTDSGIIVALQPAIREFVSVSTMALHPSRESYTGLPSATTMLSSEVQPRNNV